jgi:predicted nucleic acid-binding protein
MRQAATLADKHRLTGFDAVHLASALDVNRSLFGELSLATWDKELATAAEAEGLSLAHEVTN